MAKTLTQNDEYVQFICSFFNYSGVYFKFYELFMYEILYFQNGMNKIFIENIEQFISLLVPCILHKLSPSLNVRIQRKNITYN